MIDRRHLLAAGVAAVPGAALAQATTTLPNWPPAEAVPLWPAGAIRVPPALRPDPTVTGRAGGYRDIQLRGTTRPLFGVYRPARPDGRGVLIIPGGGYSMTSQRNEGIDVAHALLPHGITCFVLAYRLPGEGWADRANVPLADAQRALRLIRYEARRYGIDAGKLGCIGFSAGGHLAGSLATLSEVETYQPLDRADRLGARPDWAGLMYAVSTVDPGRSHGGSRQQLLGPDPEPRMQERYAVDRHITRATPPLFLVHAQDDATVPVTNSIDSFAAARQARVPVEAHFLERGGHGFGTRLPRDNPGSLWPEMFARWSWLHSFG
jgi:acetyl esterase/lipase